MMRQFEDYHVEMAFCDCMNVDNRQLDAALAKASPQDERPRWQIGDGAEKNRCPAQGLDGEPLPERFVEIGRYENNLLFFRRYHQGRGH